MTLTKENIKDIYSLSPMQEGMFFHALYDKSSPAYFEQTSFRLFEELNIELVEKSLNELVKRYDVLRTVFTQKISGRILQVVLKERPIDFHYQEISKRKDKEDYLVQYKQKDKKKSFDLTKDILIRIAVFRLDHSEYEFIWSFHHIIMDGWCTGLLVSEYFEIYRSLLENRSYHLPAVKPYRLYIDWLEKQDREISKKYWKQYLAGYEEKKGVPRLKLPKDPQDEYKHETFEFTINNQKTENLNILAREYNVTLNTIFQGVWGIVLSMYNHSMDVVFGIVVSGRPPDIEDVEFMVGLFINTIPLRIQCKKAMNFKELVKEIREKEIQSMPHHYYPLVEIQNETSLKRDLLDHIVVFENYPLDEKLKDIDWEFRNVKGFEQTNYDFDITVIPGEQLRIYFTYNGNVYDSDFVGRIGGHVQRLLEQTLKNKETAIEELELLSAKEKRQILFEFNHTKKEIQRDKCYHHLFKEQVTRQPDKIAVLDRDGQMTYGQLNKKANRIADFLILKGVKAGAIIAIYMKRSLEMLAAIIGVFKAGGAYLALDVDYPEKRIQNILENSETKVLITETQRAGTVKRINDTLPHLQAILSLDQNGESTPVLKDNPRLNPAPAITTDCLAYVIYTSGTTGKPKGVFIHQLGMINHLYANIDFLNIMESDIIAQTASPSFDISVWQFLALLIVGGATFIIDREVVLDPYRLIDVLQKGKITILEIVPSLMRAFLEIIEQESDQSLQDLRWMIPTGEAISIDLAAKWYKYYPGIKLVNAYGPAEASDDVTLWEIDRETLEKQHTIPIGKPLQNLHVYIMDPYLRLCPIKIAGEICIAGIGVGKGYLQDPEKTAKSFVPNPYSEEIGDADYFTIYKTGDLGYFHEDGTIEFLGRKDYQVKVRGHRIELGEIETQLLSHHKVKDGVVIAKEENSGDKYLCAYIVPNGVDTNGIAEELKRYLSRSLPGFMIPQHFIEMDSIPLTPNGKVDRQVLPEPGSKGTGPHDTYIGARDQVEEKLVDAWSEALDLKKGTISIDADFFQLGGHSLKAAIMVAKIHKELNVKLSLADLFEKPTIREVAKCIKNSLPYKYLSIEVTEKKEYYPLSPAQERLYFLHRVDKKSTSYNMPIVLRLQGMVNNNKLENVFTKLIKRHESLRTSFGLVDNKPVQQVIDEVEFQLEYHKSGVNSQKGNANTGKNEHQIIRNFVRPFDLSRAPLLRVGLIKLAGEKKTLMVDMHHIISDGTSHDILIQDFQLLFRGEELQPLRIQYKDYSRWQHSKKETNELNRQEEYWLKQFETGIPVLNLPIDYERPEVLNFKGSSMSFEIEKKLGADIKNLALELRTTLFVLLLTAYYILLAKYTLQNDIVVGSVVVGRHHADFQNIIGFFVNMVALRNHPGENKTFTDFLKEVNKSVFDAYENQDYQFEELVSQLAVEREPGRHPIVDTVLTLENIDIPPEDILDKKRDGFKLIPHEFEDKITHFDLLVQATAYKNSLVLGFEYSIVLFEPSTIEKMAEHYIEVLKQVKENPNILLKNIILSHEFAAAGMDPHILNEDSGEFVF